MPISSTIGAIPVPSSSESDIFQNPNNIMCVESAQSLYVNCKFFIIQKTGKSESLPQNIKDMLKEVTIDGDRITYSVGSLRDMKMTIQVNCFFRLEFLLENKT